MEKVDETAVSHWEDYQKDIDEKCDTSKMMEIPYKIAIITILLYFITLIGGLILHWSEKKVNIWDGSLYISPSIIGGVVAGVIAFVGGYLMGRFIKRAAIVVPLALLLPIPAAMIACMVGPSIIPGAYLWRFEVRVADDYLIGSLMTLVGSLVSLSAYHYD
ncbi:MAG: hypothetical protein HZB92_07735 [Euryarchaeota archaeon]|nr:hypothetical protein [Euryarchaeota archaeon]